MTLVGESFVMSYCAKEVLMEMKKLIIKCDQEEVFTVQVIMGGGGRRELCDELLCQGSSDGNEEINHQVWSGGGVHCSGNRGGWGGGVNESFVMSYCAKEVLMEMKKLIIKCDQEEVFSVQVIMEVVYVYRDCRWELIIKYGQDEVFAVQVMRTRP